MPSHQTFTIKPVKKLLERTFGADEFVDPFPFPFKADALEYLKSFDSQSVKSLVFDPPYSLRQLKEMYNNQGQSLSQHDSQRYYADIRDEIARITSVGAKVVSFGWQSIGIGKKRGFSIVEVLLVCHGRMHNDTICTVDLKTRHVSPNANLPFVSGEN